jgi:hypothetical protein
MVAKFTSFLVTIRTCQVHPDFEFMNYSLKRSLIDLLSVILAARVLRLSIERAESAAKFQGIDE